MLDFRHSPQTSPIFWCPHCQALVPAEFSVKIMKTVYRVEREGIFPFGVCYHHTNADQIPLKPAPEEREERVVAHV
ncbi:hypothetical protein FY534_05385 [Alicyclobacillus sp. TC]|uniref:Uncharacterized protein n=2 Tax=Alicyclobacillus tolerans TaxID=90970 RepID=A0ABT9LT62_9BACL|nr:MULTISPECIES: hypothetical protein [Alicyclobacillus]MDP9727445.1 hypothetical protein [Alicyclobacillus tengchongensis]QRF23166.1 hypothetical protein FY534_05385 [Alicyclobacillus sp. TC]SHJ48337.1 hypothetical protein SAMN05443507_1017 [Alicyclobacillus montanus]